MFNNFIFDLQRFEAEISGDKVKISAGENYSVDGVTFTAISDAQLIFDGDKKISGIAIGKIRAFLTDKENSPEITFDATETALNFTATSDGKAIMSKISVIPVELEKGAFTYDGSTFTAEKNSDMIFNFSDYTLKATASESIQEIFSFTNNGISISPSGKLNITLNDGNNSMDAALEVLKGSLTLSENGALTVAGGSELQIDFGNDYIVNFKASDDAGGKISISDDGIIFTPNEGDGHLELSVAQGGKPRATSLEMNGSLTYKLDGSISLAEGTVLKNIFEDGNELTITAKTDASGSIIFSPQDGLQITPSTPDALEVVLSNKDFEVAKFSSVTGTINYSGGVVTAEDGARSHLSVYDTWETELSTTGGTSSIAFMSDRTVYTANDGATFILDYLDGTTVEIQSGSFSDIYATETEDAIELISAGSTLKTNDDEFKFTLEKASNYTINGIAVTTSADNVQVQLANYDTIIVDGISYTALDENLKLTIDDTTAKVSGDKVGLKMEGLGKSFNLDTTNGSISYDSATKKFICAAGTVFYVQQDDFIFSLTAKEDFSASYKIEEEIFYFMLDESFKADMSIVNGGQTVIDNATFEVGGVFSYRPETGTFGLTGANSSHGDGTNTFVQFTLNGEIFRAETNDTTLVFIPTYNDGKFEFKFPNENKQAMKFTVGKDGQTTFESNITVDGTIGIDTATQEISLTKDTVIKLSQGDKALEFTALNDAGGKISFSDDGITFNPNENDGKLELNFVDAGRKANLSVTGAIIFRNDGNISLENGTEINLAWKDGNKLKLTSRGSTGSINFGDKGLKITSNDENLDMKLTTSAGFTTDISAVKGSLWYNAGVVSFDENSKLTATSTIGGQPIFTTLETVGGTGFISFNTSNGVLYSADTGALKVTWSKDDLESTFIVNSGSVQLGHNLFRITEGSDIATDLKNFVPAFYFTTSEAGTYTINGQTIKTSAANLALTATDDYMSFKTSNDVVEYDGMTFAGSGNVSLKPDIVVLGDGVKATGFGEGNSFMLAEAGNVTVDAKIFEATSLKNKLDEEIPLNVSVEGNDDGFTFSRVITRQSEDYFSKPDYSNIGKIFREEFHSDDDSYRIHTDPIGLQEIIGITSPSTINAAAEFDDEPEETIFDIVTDSEGSFTIGEKTYLISGDDSVAIKAIYNTSIECARGFDSLNGTVNGDFTDHAVSINGSSGVQVFGDTDVSISANKKSYKIFGLYAGASVSVAAAGIYSVNSTSIAAAAGDVIVGNLNGAAHLYVENYLENTLSNTLISGSDEDDYIENSGSNVTIDAGAGKNFVTLSGTSEVIVFSGDTTVEGFDTGFGEGSDTLYIPEAPPAVDFKSGGLTFYDDDNSITFSDINSTAKFNMYQGSKGSLETAVFIADDEWYKVADSDLAPDNNKSIYFVGATDKFTHGVDFSGVTKNLNVTIDTDYELTDNKIWINNVGSIKGGAGLTTITGSKSDDTIIAGTGNTTINGAGGDDLISLQNGSALIEYKSGDGNDTIKGFNADSTLSISGGKYSSTINGSDMILTVGDDSITLIDAANKNLNIIGKRDVSVEEVEKLIGSKNKVSLSGGAQTVRLNDDGGNLAIVTGNGGEKTIELGDGGDAVAIYADKNSGTSVEVIGDAGNDTLIAFDNAPVTFDMSAGGKDKVALVTANQNVTLEGYDPTQGGGIATNKPTVSDIVNEIMAGTDTRFGNGNVSLKTSEETQSVFTLADKTNSKDTAIINFLDAKNHLLPVGFTNSAGGTLDVSNSSDNYLLIGNYFGGKSGGSTLLGGAGDDTVLGGEGDFIEAGTGNNLIKLAEDVERDGATVVLSRGRTTVENFTANDILSLDTDTDGNYQFDGTNVLIKMDAGIRATLEPIGNDPNLAEFFISEENIGVTKFVVIKNDAIAKVADLSARAYIGENSGVDFSNVEEDISVVLNDVVDTLHDTPLLFSGINYVAGGKGNSTLIGSKRNETLIAGSGNTSIWSGAGKDSLVGNTSSDKNGSTTFFFEEGDQINVVSGFEFLTTDNSSTADKIDTNGQDIKDAFVSGDRVIVKLYDNSVLALNDAAGKDFQINDLIAKVDKNVTYDGLANCYVAYGGSSLSVDSSVDSAEIWLDNSHGDIFIGNIRTLDASAVEGNTSLVGNDFNNTIIAGQGDSSLWGGNSSSDDLLIGGAGKNTFFYLQGNGRDTVQGVNDGDEIILDNVTLDEIISADISAENVTLNFTDGGSLKVDGRADVTYQLADGSKYSANHEWLEWDSK